MNRFTVVAGTAAVVAVTAAGVTFAARSGGTDGAGGARDRASSQATAGTDGNTDGTGSGTGSSGSAYYAGSLNGRNEVPASGGPAVGDKDGKAIAFLRVQGDKVSFALKYRGIAAPTAAHVHQGGKGADGDVKIPLLREKKPADGRTSVSGTVSGTVTVKDRQLLKDLASHPNGFYFNVHTGEFPGGAVRGQVHKLSRSLTMDAAATARNSFQASVTRGSQIYACTRRPGGGYAFTQNDVRARLGGGIAHSFTRPAGPPRWVAPDGSAVTGEVVSKTPNGTGNIPELDLRATRSATTRPDDSRASATRPADTRASASRTDGLLADTAEILRLNTVGGAAPTGACDPARQPTIAVPYEADYLFVGK
ncbi:CHRD domain-containing protein [Streptomyces sp. NPDC050617]|uniref:CHRD domain-containing protein n=1 Tax=Streptomyces sp. NPDC050617 TaxID=3154628 RepID=UPI00341A8194